MKNFHLWVRVLRAFGRLRLGEHAHSSRRTSRHLFLSYNDHHSPVTLICHRSRNIRHLAVTGAPAGIWNTTLHEH